MTSFAAIERDAFRSYCTIHEFDIWTRSVLNQLLLQADHRTHEVRTTGTAIAAELRITWRAVKKALERLSDIGAVVQTVGPGRLLIIEIAVYDTLIASRGRASRASSADRASAISNRAGARVNAIEARPADRAHAISDRAHAIPDRAGAISNRAGAITQAADQGFLACTQQGTKQAAAAEALLLLVNNEIGDKRRRGESITNEGGLRRSITRERTDRGDLAELEALAAESPGATPNELAERLLSRRAELAAAETPAVDSQLRRARQLEQIRSRARTLARVLPPIDERDLLDELCGVVPAGDADAMQAAIDAFAEVRRSMTLSSEAAAG